MNEIIIIMLSMVASMILGAFFALMMGGSTSFKYLRVKSSRGKKVLLFLHTAFGWVPVVATKEENTLYWKYDKKKYITDISDENSLTRYLRVDAAYTILDYPTVALKVNKGALHPENFDPQTFNNLLVRAATRPSATGADDIKKMVQIVLVLVVIVGLACMIIYGKVAALQQAIEALNTVAAPVV